MGKKHPKTHQLEIVALEALSSKAVVSNGGKKKMRERERIKKSQLQLITGKQKRRRKKEKKTARVQKHGSVKHGPLF